MERCASSSYGERDFFKTAKWISFVKQGLDNITAAHITTGSAQRSRTGAKCYLGDKLTCVSLRTLDRCYKVEAISHVQLCLHYDPKHCLICVRVYWRMGEGKLLIISYQNSL